MEVSMEELFDSVFNNSSYGIVTLDLEGNIASANPPAKKLLGILNTTEKRSIDELDRLDQGTKNKLKELLSERKKEHGSRDRDLEINYTDGSSKWVQLRSNEIRGQGRRIAGYTVLVYDITKRVEDEKALSESAHRFKMLVENMNEGVGITDLEENIIYANKALGKILGGDPSELIGRNVMDFVLKENRSKVKEGTRRRKTGEVGEYEIEIINIRGERRYVNISASPWTREDGVVIGTMGLLQDITTQKLSEIALVSSEEKYRAAVEQSAENIYIYDIERKRILEANQALRSLLGYNEEEIKKLEPGDFIAHSNTDIKSKIETVMKEGRAIIGERTYIRKDGEKVDVEVSASRISEGEQDMLCVVSRDITQKKRARELLIQERNRAEFYLDLLAHDIGNIHHAMMGGLSLYNIYGDDISRKDDAVKMIEGLMIRSLKLVENIMTYSKLQSSDPVLDVIDLENVMEAGYIAAISSFSDREIEHIKTGDPKGIKIFAEPMMEEVFFNLYHNSFKFQSEGRIKVRTTIRKEDNRVVIGIEDRGQGIPDIKKDNIFDRPKEPQMMQHTGLGIVIIHTLVKRYNGKIWVEDRIKGDHTKGSVFYMEFPISC